MTSTKTTNTTDTLTAWKKRHWTITLPSGAVVTIKLLDLETHLAFGHSPDGLRMVALADLAKKISNDETPSEERDAAQQEMATTMYRVVVAMLVDPVITLDDVADLPDWDVEMLVQIANRSIDRDALGQQIGLVRLDTVAAFRPLDGRDDGGAQGEGLAVAVPASVAG